ncbi:MAG: carbon-nitrogen hydrolase family protein [Rhodothermales bacterium]
MKEPLKGRVRVAGAQYFIRPIERFSQFEDQVSSTVATAADYQCRLVVLPEYFTLQLASLGDVKRPFREQLRDVASFVPRFVDVLSGLATRHGIYIVAGTIPVRGSGDDVHNESFLFSPSGDHAVQGKLHMTRFEREDWDVSPSERMKVFDTDFGKLAVAICYDVEFPELVRAAARKGAHLLAVPSNTDDRQGFLRVRYCAHARTIENQMYVVHTTTVGGLPRVPDVSLNYGQASILTPSDFAFARDGILAESVMNQETLIVGELDMKTIDDSRTFGTVLPLNDSHHTRELIADIQEITL